MRITSPEISARAGEAARRRCFATFARAPEFVVAVLKYRADVSGDPLGLVADRRCCRWRGVANGYREAFRRNLFHHLRRSPCWSRGWRHSLPGRGHRRRHRNSARTGKSDIGNGCIVRSLLALKTVEPDALQSSRKCLEETLRYRPGDPDVQASLANVLLMIDPPDAPTALFRDRAGIGRPIRGFGTVLGPQRGCANDGAVPGRQYRSGDLRRSSRNGAQSRQWAHFRQLANILFTVGRWSDGIALLSAADVAGSDSPYFEGQTALALDAYRRGDFDATLVNLQEIDGSRCYIDQHPEACCTWPARTRAGGKDGRQFFEVAPAGFEKSFRSDMAMRHFEPTMISSLEVGLLKAT